MSPLRMRMIEDMKLSGLSPATQATYIDAVRKLAAHYRRSPDQLSEEEVRAYILSLRERGAARGTFKTNYYGIRYLYRYTLNWDWALFSKKIRLPRQKRLPHALAEAEVRRLLGGITIAGDLDLLADHLKLDRFHLLGVAEPLRRRPRRAVSIGR